MTTTPKLVALIKASVKLAIIRHGLVQEDNEEVDADSIARDVANAVQGIDTCEEKPMKEWRALIRKGKR